jgi:GWxTD domain-containing protein
MMKLLIFLLFLSSEIDFSYTRGIFVNERKPEIRIYFNIERDKLVFIRRGDSFLSSHSISVILKDKKGKERGDTWMREVTLPTYEQTVESKEFITDSIKLRIMPGNYSMELVVSDNNSDRKGVKRENISIPKIDSLFISNVIPRAGNIISQTLKFNQDEPIGLFFTIYNFTEKPITVSCSVDDKWDTLAVNKMDEVMPFSLEIPNLKRNKRVISIKAASNGWQFRRDDTISISLPFFTLNFEEKVHSLEYIAEDREIDTLLRAKPSERESLWAEFWKRRDPSPGTAINEFKEQYLRRVAYANEKFGGWRTDRGRVYVIMGMPDDIERHQFELESQPYEIWYYYGTNEKFIFLDKHGIGDYTLVYPEHWNPKK